MWKALVFVLFTQSTKSLLCFKDLIQEREADVVIDLGMDEMRGFCGKTDLTSLFRFFLIKKWRRKRIFTF